MRLVHRDGGVYDVRSDSFFLNDGLDMLVYMMMGMLRAYDRSRRRRMRGVMSHRAVLVPASILLFDRRRLVFLSMLESPVLHGSGTMAVFLRPTKG